MLKKVHKSVHPDEVKIAQYFSAEPLSSDPRNHCVQLLEVLPVPDDDDLTIMVFPFLTPFDSPFFRTVGEVVDFLSQVFEVSLVYTLMVLMPTVALLQGLLFMHEHHVAHRFVNLHIFIAHPYGLIRDFQRLPIP